MTGKKWLRNFILLMLISLVLTGGVVAYVDPFFHYGPPKDHFFYRLFEQRSQNDGITRFFDYDAIITGTSMAENFKTSVFDEEFGTDSIKVPYSGATYREINDNLKRSYESGHDVKYVLRPLDYSQLITDKDLLREDMGEYPEGLYNSNPFDDVKYLLNRDVIINFTLPAMAGAVRGKEGGWTSFDDYSYTGDMNEFGRDAVLLDRGEYLDARQEAATEEEIATVDGNIAQNVVALAKEHPDTVFLYFFTPYSMAYWGDLRQEGSMEKYLFLIRRATEQMLQCENIHLYSFGLFRDITSDLSYYRDVAHYSPEVSDMMIRAIAAWERGTYTGDVPIRLTPDSADDFYDEFEDYIRNFNYNSLLDQ
jgi:hypothetical protein